MITDSEIQKAIREAQPGGRPIILRDPGERGAGRLTLVVRRGSSQVAAEWYATWHRNGDRHTTQIGRYPALSLKAARALYRDKYLPAIMAGQNPIGPKAVQRSYGLTVTDLFEAYVDDLEYKKKKSAGDVRRLLLGPKGAVHDIGPRRLAKDVEPTHMTPHLAAIRARGALGQANLVRSYLCAAFSFGIKAPNKYDGSAVGVDWGLTSNPAARIDVDRDARNPRDRALTPQEFARLWWWLHERAPHDRRALAVQLMMLTGQRPGEVMRIRLPAISGDGVMSWPKTKNGRAHAIPLVGIAKALVDSSEPNEFGLFFWSPSRPAVPAAVASARAFIENYLLDTGAKAFTPRDLRRTWKTLAGDAGVNKAVRDLIQNHRTNDVSTRHYDRYDYAREKRNGLMQWDAYVWELLSKHPAAPLGAFYTFEGFSYDDGSGDLRSPEGRVRLVPSERAMLQLFLENPQKVMAREEIIKLAFEAGETPSRSAVDLRISRLRARLGNRGFEIIKTVRGAGFCLAAPVVVERPTRVDPVQDGPRLSAGAGSEAVSLLRRLEVGGPAVSSVWPPASGAGEAA
jgi:integrase/DNA-binding winged helix-turn-helix (wHTH) protein